MAIWLRRWAELDAEVDGQDGAAALAGLEARLRVLEDERAIREVIADYGFFADSGQHDEWVSNFTADGTIELVGREATGIYPEVARWTGPEALRDFIDDPRVHMTIEGRCMHVTTGNLRTRIDGDDAVAETYYVVLVKDGDSIVVANGGFTQLQLRRVDGLWRIQRRLRHQIGTDVALLRAGHPRLNGSVG
jgi:hypothetical protein